jgi:hypothetical protein
LDIYDKKRQAILARIREEEGSFPKSRETLSNAQLEKIENHAIRFGHEVDEVLQSVLADSVAFRAIVGKNPSRMDYYEDSLVEYLESLEPVKQASKLPKGGKGAFHLDNGSIKQGVKTKFVKSLDILVEFKNGKHIWLIHKYTVEGGGAQDSAFRDAELTLQEALGPGNIAKVNVAAVLDGAYYQERSKKTGLTRIESARLTAPHAVVGTYLEFEELTKKIWSE